MNLPYHLQKQLFLIVVFLLISVFYNFFPQLQSPQKDVLPSQDVNPSRADNNHAYVTDIIDGDTIEVSINGQKEKVRLIGIDTPEVVDPRKPIQCFGKEASFKTKELLTDKIVYLESDPTQANRDRYNRLLRYVYLEDNTLINKVLIQEGFAYEYTYDIPYKFQQEFKNTQEQAQLEEKGLWADTTCSGSRSAR